MTLIRKIFSFSSINMLNAAVPFLLLPLLTARLSTADYGLLSVFQLYAALLLPLATFNLSSAVSREYFTLAKQDLAGLIGSVIFLPVLACLLITAAVLACSGAVSGLTGLPVRAVLFLPFFVAAQFIPTLVMTLLQVRADIRMFAVFKLGIAAVNLLLTFAFFYFTLHGWYGRVEAVLIAQLLFSVAGLVFLKTSGYWRPAFNTVQIKNALAFSLPLIPHTVSGILLSMTDRIILARYLDMDSVGIYSVAFQIASVMAILMGSINQAWAPHLFSQLKNTDVDRHKMVRDSYLMMLLMALATAIFLPCVPLLYRLLVDPQYHGGIYLVKYITLGFLFQGFYFIFTNYIFYAKRTAILSMLTACCALFNVIASIVLVQKLGVAGSAFSMAITWLLFALLTWIVSHQCIAMPWLRLKRGSV